MLHILTFRWPDSHFYRRCMVFGAIVSELEWLSSFQAWDNWCLSSSIRFQCSVLFSGVLLSLRFVRFLIFRTSRSVNHAAWLVFTIPGAVTVFVQWTVSCPDWWIMWFRTLNCCFGFYVSCLIFPPICMSQSYSLGVYWTSQEMRDGFERSTPLSFPSRAAMSTTPSSRYNTIPCVVVLFYRIFLAWIDHSLYSWRGGWRLFRFLHFPLFRGPFWEFIDPLFTVSLRPFVVKKMRDWENILLHELSRMVSIKMLLIFDIYRMRFPLCRQ